MSMSKRYQVESNVKYLELRLFESYVEFIILKSPAPVLVGHPIHLKHGTPLPGGEADRERGCDRGKEREGDRQIERETARSREVVSATEESKVDERG